MSSRRNKDKVQPREFGCSQLILKPPSIKKQNAPVKRALGASSASASDGAAASTSTSKKNESLTVDKKIPETSTSDQQPVTTFTEGESGRWCRMRSGKVRGFLGQMMKISGATEDKLVRQHEVELKICEIVNGSWRRRYGLGMRIEITEKDYACLEKIYTDSEDETSEEEEEEDAMAKWKRKAAMARFYDDPEYESEEDSYGSDEDDIFGGFGGGGLFGGLGGFGRGGQKKKRKDKSRGWDKVRCVQFAFKDVESVKMETRTTSIADVAADAQKQDGIVCGIEIVLKRPVGCFVVPHYAEDHFFKKTPDFANGSTTLLLGFSREKQASAVLTFLQSKLTVGRNERASELWKEQIVAFHDRISLASAKVVAKMLNHEQNGVCSTTPTYHRAVLALKKTVSALPETSFARISIEKWNLVPPTTLLSTTGAPADGRVCFSAPVVVKKCTSPMVIPGISLPPAEVEALWARYHELRKKDMQRMVKDMEDEEEEDEYGDHGGWDTGMGEVPPNKRRG